MTNRTKKETEDSTFPMISYNSVLMLEKMSLIHDNGTPWTGDWHIARPLCIIC